MAYGGVGISRTWKHPPLTPALPTPAAPRPAPPHSLRSLGSPARSGPQSNSQTDQPSGSSWPHLTEVVS